MLNGAETLFLYHFADRPAAPCPTSYRPGHTERGDCLKDLPMTVPAAPLAPIEVGPDHANRRNAPRFTLMIRAARLILDGRDYLCVIRDVSATGMKIRLFHPLPPHGALAIGLGNGECHGADVAWSEGDHIGLQFHSPTSVDSLLDEDCGPKPRAPIQLKIGMEALVHAGREAMPARFVTISQQSASIEVSQKLVIGEHVRIQTAMLQPLIAKVRARGRTSPAGMTHELDFDSPFRLDELARATMAIHLTAGILAGPATFAPMPPASDRLRGRSAG
jgi:hypothetical protein